MVERRFALARQWLAISASGMLAACATIPELPAPARPRANALADAKADKVRLPFWPQERWWERYGDPQLNRLVDEAVAGSPDLAEAVARARRAAALADQARAPNRLVATVSGQVGGLRQSQNAGIPPAFVPDGVVDVGQGALQFGLDLDLWRRNQASLRAALGEAVAAEIDVAQARLILTAAVAAGYNDYRQSERRRALAAEAVAIREQSRALTASRVAEGLEADSALAQSGARLEVAKADLVAADERLTIARLRLAALIGAAPDRANGFSAPTAHVPDVDVPAEAGVDLLGRRPDLVSARLRAEAASARIDVARADFYPNVSLTALVGLQAFGLDRLLVPGSIYGNAGPALNLPIFDGRRRQARYRAAAAEYDEAVARYDRTLLGALRDVAEALASRAAARAAMRPVAAALAEAERARKLALLRYQSGLSSQFPVLLADDALIDVRRRAVDLEARLFDADVALSAGLGGGFMDPGTKGAH